MGGSENIKTILYKTIHRNNKTIDQIADEIGVSSNSLYRYCLEGESGSDMPLKRLVPLMKTTKNYDLLKHIAFLAGFVCVKIPKYTKIKGDHYDIINDYQDATTKTTRELKKFFDEPNFESYQKLTESLKEVIEKSVSNHEYAKKVTQGQLEIEL